MTQFLVSLIAGNGGAIVRWIAGAIIATLVSIVARLGFELPGDVVTQIAAGVTIAVAGALGEIANKVNVNGVAQIQAALAKVADDVRKDGHAGQVTVDAAKQIVALLKK